MSPNQSNTGTEGVQPSDHNPIVPQDKTGRTNDVVAGLSLSDMALSALPPAALFLIITDVLGYDLSWPIIGACVVLGAILLLLCWLAPYYLKPSELVRRNLAAVRDRVRMPLVHEDAWEVPGIRDLFWGWDALAREDDAVFGAVEIGAVPSESFDQGELFAYHYGLAMAINSKIERVDGGFDIQLHASQFGSEPTTFGELDSILDIAPVDSDLNDYERAFAEARADHGYDHLAESGVMDRSFRIIVPVGPEEGEGVGRVEKWLRDNLSTLGVTDAHRISQLRLLDRRIDQVLGMAGYAGGGRRLTTAELIELQRDHWQGRDAPNADIDIESLSRSGTVITPEHYAAQLPDHATPPEELLPCLEEGRIYSPLEAQESTVGTRTVTREHDRESEPIRSRGVPPAGATDQEAIQYHIERGEAHLDRGRKVLSTSRQSSDNTTPKDATTREKMAAARTTARNAHRETTAWIRLARAVGRSLHRSAERHADSDTRERMYDVYAPTNVAADSGSLVLKDETGEPIEYTRSYMIAHLPTRLPYGILDAIDTLPGVRLDRSVHLRATDRLEKRDDLDDDRDALANNALFKEMFGRADTEDADALAADTIELYEHLRDGVEAVEASITVTIRGDTKAELDDHCTDFKNVCAANNIQYRNPKRQLLAFKSTAPMGYDALHDKSDIPVPFDMPSDAIGNLSSFPGYVRQDENGRTMGFVKTEPGDDGQVIDTLQVNRLALTSPHITSIGRSGAGKTAGENEGVIEESLRNPEWTTVVSDVAQGFHGLEGVHDERASRVKPPETTINLFEFDPPTDDADANPAAAFDLWVETITSALMIQVKQRGGDQAGDLRDTLADAIREVFEWHGLTRETAHLSREERELPQSVIDAIEAGEIGAASEADGELTIEDFLADDGSPRHPIMQDLFRVFDYMTDYPERFVRDKESYTTSLADEVNDLYMFLRAFEQGNQFDFLNGQSEIDLSAETLIFDLSHYEDNDSVIKSILNVVKTAVAYNAAKDTDHEVLLVLDELHESLYDQEEAEKLATLLRAGRNHGLMFTAISQATKDFLQGPGSIFVDNSSCVIIHEVGNKDASLASDIGLSESKEQLVRNQLETGDKEGSEYAEALVILEQGREVYLVEKRYPDLIKRIVAYERGEHGDFDLYLAGIPREDQHFYHIEEREGGKVAVRDQTQTAPIDAGEEPSEDTPTSVRVPTTVTDGGQTDG